MGNVVWNSIGVSTGHVFFYSCIFQPWNYFSVSGINFFVYHLKINVTIFIVTLYLKTKLF